MPQKNIVTKAANSKRQVQEESSNYAYVVWREKHISCK